MTYSDEQIREAIRQSQIVEGWRHWGEMLEQLLDERDALRAALAAAPEGRT